MSNKARIHYILDAVIALAFIMSAVSGLVLWLGGSGGYQGGRNPAYQATILSVSRAAWHDLHLWGSLVMMAGIGLHLLLHWRWIVCMTRDILLPRRRRTRGHPAKPRPMQALAARPTVKMDRELAPRAQGIGPGPVSPTAALATPLPALPANMARGAKRAPPAKGPITRWRHGRRSAAPWWRQTGAT